MSAVGMSASVEQATETAASTRAGRDRFARWAGPILGLVLPVSAGSISV